VAPIFAASIYAPFCTCVNPADTGIDAKLKYLPLVIRYQPQQESETQQTEAATSITYTMSVQGEANITEPEIETAPPPVKTVGFQDLVSTKPMLTRRQMAIAQNRENDAKTEAAKATLLAANETKPQGGVAASKKKRPPASNQAANQPATTQLAANETMAKGGVAASKKKRPPASNQPANQPATTQLVANDITAKVGAAASKKKRLPASNQPANQPAKNRSGKAAKASRRKKKKLAPTASQPEEQEEDSSDNEPDIPTILDPVTKKHFSIDSNTAFLLQVCPLDVTQLSCS
jgi:hypothetical protein